MIPERDVVKACLRLLQFKGIMAWRSNNAGIRVGEGAGRYAFHGKLGVPDILGILPSGRFLGVECKSETGRQSESQAAFQAECERAGGCYLLVRSAAELSEQLATVCLRKPWEDNRSKALPGESVDRG